MKERTFTEEQVTRARAVDQLSRSRYYQDHDRDEMEHDLELLGGDIDDLGRVNMTRLTDAVLALAKTVLEINGREANYASAVRALERWPEANNKQIADLLEQARANAQEMVEHPWTVGTYYKHRAQLEIGAEVHVRAELRRILYDTPDKGETWTRNSNTLVQALAWMQEELFDGLRSGYSSCPISNASERMKTDARRELVRDLRRVVRRAIEKGILDRRQVEEVDDES